MDNAAAVCHLRDDAISSGSDLCGTFELATRPSSEVSLVLVAVCSVAWDAEVLSRPLVYEHLRHEHVQRLTEICIASTTDLTVQFSAAIPADWPGTMHFTHGSTAKDPEWATAGELLLTHCAVVTRLEARLDRTVMYSREVIVNPRAHLRRSPLGGSTDAHNSVAVLQCRLKGHSKSSAPVTIQLTLEGSVHAAAPFCSPPLPGPEQAPASASTPGFQQHPAPPPPPLVVHAHIHNTAHVDIASIRLRAIRRLRLQDGTGAVRLQETVLSAVDGGRCVRRADGGGVHRHWHLPWPWGARGAKALVGGEDEAALLPLSSCVYAPALEVTHAVEVQVLFDGSPEPHVALLPFWLDPPPAALAVPAPARMTPYRPADAAAALAPDAAHVLVAPRSGAHPEALLLPALALHAPPGRVQRGDRVSPRTPGAETPQPQE